MNNKKITIFTPTYNRGYILKRLYESLVKQTCQDFCWLIVDDGSTDDTEKVVEEWINKKEIQIRYVKQTNQGKSLAHNKGVELTETELFTCVDSDDYLKSDAIEKIIACWKTSRTNDVGILAFKISEKKPVTKIKKGGNGIRTTLKNAYDHLGLVGDTMLIFKSETIKQYCFPHFLGEKFVPEGYLYDKIDQDGLLILLEEPLYICEYLDGGYTNNMSKLLANNPCGYLAFIKQRLEFDNSIKDRFLDSIRYVAMAKVHKERIIKNSVYPLYAILAYPAGLLFFYKKYKNVIGENNK